MFMTNGGGYTEQHKAEQLSSKLGVKICGEQVCLAHTPMQSPEIIKRHRDETVLVVGKRGSELKSIAMGYGFTDVITVQELHQEMPYLYPDMEPEQVPRYEPKSSAPLQIGAVLTLTDPIYMFRDLQLSIDALRGTGDLKSTTDTQQVALYDACADVEYSSNYHIHRLGSGAFSSALIHLFEETVGRPLPAHRFGKPRVASYHYMERMIQNYSGHRPDRIFMVGDNPATDIRGALEAGSPWFAVLTRTGMFQGEGNDETYPGHYVADDLDAVAELVLDYCSSS